MHAGTLWFSFNIVYTRTAGYIRLASFKTYYCCQLLCMDNIYLFDEASIHDHKQKTDL